MYNTGDNVLFVMKGKIVDRIHDQHGVFYLVEYNDPVRNVIRVPEANMQHKFMPEPKARNPRRPMPPSPYDQSSAGCGSMPEHMRRPQSPNPCYIDGVSQSPQRIGGEYWRRDSFSDLKPPRPDRRLAALGCPFPPGTFDEHPEG